MSKDSENDEDLWDLVTKGIKKLGAKEKISTPLRKKRIRLKPNEIVISLPNIELPSGGGLDRKTEDRVRKGEIKIEARLDLHGLTADSARQALLQFVQQAYASNKRCILVITGKGRIPGAGLFSEGKGIIRKEFPLWLEEANIKALILSVSKAQPKHGGTGAYYIYLRKNRQT